MYLVTFKCVFLSDVILNANTATEGASQSLHYIPGSNFLGIVARDYSSFGNRAFDIFHSGKVRFGDAHLSINNNRSLKMPASWFFEKTDEEKQKPYIHHAVTEEMRDKHREDGIQLKQVRSGFFEPESNIKIEVEQDFTIKSAYNLDERRSAEGQLYGYNCLRKGTEWIFSVEADSEELINEVKHKLLGRKNIGRSRSAQYGLVEITELALVVGQYLPEKIINSQNKDILVLYFESCAAFVDKYGEPTFQPSMDSLKLDREDGEFNWNDSQTRTRSFSPWNRTRKTRDADRVCIDKGSVLAIDIKKGIDLKAYIKKLESGVGLYRQEGFGKVIVNPSFLCADSEARYLHKLKKSEKRTERINSEVLENDNSDKDILCWIDAKTKFNESMADVVRFTNSFIENKYSDFKHISASQWGSVREVVSRIQDSNKDRMRYLFGDPNEDQNNNEGLLRRGKSEEEWRYCWKTLRNEIDKTGNYDIARSFLINLCSEMAKKRREGEQTK